MNSLHAFEWILLDGLVPLKTLPKDKPGRVAVDLFVVARMRHPEFRRLPVDCADETAND